MKLPIIQRRTFVREGRGLPLPTAVKLTVTWFLNGFYPATYEREVRRPYSGEELRQLRKERGVGQVRRITA